MGLDWTALEQGISRVALQKAAAIIAEHPGQSFYGLALHGVPTEEDGVLVLPVLALNSHEALARDLSDADDEDEGPDEPDWDVAADDYVPMPLDGSDPPERLDDEGDDDDPDDEDESDDAEDTDEDVDDSSGGFYSRRWDPAEWHWNAVELVDDAAAGVWERAFAAEVAANGWAPTAQRYYELMVRVVKDLRQGLLAGSGKEVVCFVADNDHAERLLRASLTAGQLRAHFPELATA